MSKRFFFNERDLERLRRLSDAELYILNDELGSKVHEAKGNVLIIMSSEETITQLVSLAETALKEIARRGEFTPITSLHRNNTLHTLIFYNNFTLFINSYTRTWNLIFYISIFHIYFFIF